MIFVTDYRADWRALCVELVDGWAQGCDIAGPIARARAVLAQPEPETPTDEEIGEWQSHCAYLTSPAACGGAGVGDHYWAFDVECDHVASIVRAAITRWALPTIKPVPVAERLPEAEDCNEDGDCWWLDAHGWGWYMDSFQGNYSHWLPHHALPVPGAEVGND